MTKLRIACAALVAGMLAAACGNSEPARTPAGGKVSCTSDSDCVVTTFGGCCACCPSAPHAVPAEALDKQKGKCAVVECAACSERIGCPSTEPESTFVAACKDGTCAAVHK
jgi:hypothetical protein